MPGTHVAGAVGARHVPGTKVWGTAHQLMIAATALVHGLTLATRNVADFEGMGVKIVDPWAEGQ